MPENVPDVNTDVQKGAQGEDQLSSATVVLQPIAGTSISTFATL
jgi:hypothetical protein